MGIQKLHNPLYIHSGITGQMPGRYWKGGRQIVWACVNWKTCPVSRGYSVLGYILGVWAPREFHIFNVNLWYLNGHPISLQSLHTYPLGK